MEKQQNETWREYVAGIGKEHGLQFETEKFFDFALKKGLSEEDVAEYALADWIK